MQSRRPPRVVLRPRSLLAQQPLIPTRRPFVAASPSRRLIWMKTALLKTMPGPISIVRNLKTLVAISAPAVHLVPGTLETMRHNCLIEISRLPQPLILLAANSARCQALVIRHTSHARHRSERGTIGSAHEKRSFGRLMHGSSPFLRLGWPVGVEPTRDMSHSHARHSRSRHGHSWSTRGYSKTHSADYRSAALPLELQVQTFGAGSRTLTRILRHTEATLWC